jgi:hypothetical protein
MFTNHTSSAPQGGTTFYDFKVENKGALLATNVQAELELAAGIIIDESDVRAPCSLSGNTIVCGYSELTAGSHQSESFRVTMPPEVGPVDATLTATSDAPEQNSLDNTVVLTRQVIAAMADLRISSAGGERLFKFTGSQWDLSVNTQNFGPHNVNELQVTLDLPAEVDVISINTTAECTGEHPVICSSGVGRVIGFVLSSLVPGIYEFPVNVSWEYGDPNLSNNTKNILLFVGDSVDSIQSQVNDAADGAEIQVPAGYYLGELSYAKNINLVAVDGPENTFWASQTENISVDDANSGEITGFTFTLDGYIRLSSSDLNLHDNVFEDLIFGQAIQTLGTTSAIIERNILRNSDTQCPDLNGLIDIVGESDPLIRNNLFLNNNCTAISFIENPGSAAVITNNDFIDGGTAVKITADDRDAGAYVGNNIFHGNEIGIKTYTSCDDCTAFQSNLFYNNGLNYQNSADEAGVNDILADPMFGGAELGDYTLQSGSPAIDAGNALNAPADDFAENSRPVDGDGSGTAEPDIGAYEFQPLD